MRLLELVRQLTKKETSLLAESGEGAGALTLSQNLDCFQARFRVMLSNVGWCFRFSYENGYVTG